MPGERIYGLPPSQNGCTEFFFEGVYFVGSGYGKGKSRRLGPGNPVLLCILPNLRGVLKKPNVFFVERWGVPPYPQQGKKLNSDNKLKMAAKISGVRVRDYNK
jgi:hypothetical protein